MLRYEWFSATKNLILIWYYRYWTYFCVCLILVLCVCTFIILTRLRYNLTTAWNYVVKFTYFVFWEIWFYVITLNYIILCIVYTSFTIIRFVASPSSDILHLGHNVMCGGERRLGVVVPPQGVSFRGHVSVWFTVTPSSASQGPLYLSRRRVTSVFLLWRCVSVHSELNNNKTGRRPVVVCTRQREKRAGLSLPVVYSVTRNLRKSIWW